MSQQVLTPGLDPTSYTSITGAQLSQMFTLATFASGIGGVIVTTDVNGSPVVPPGGTDSTLQSYIWIRVGASAISSYIWNPLTSSNVTYLQWTSLVSSAIGTNAVTGGPTGNIALSTITSDNIAYVSGSQITGTLSTSTLANLVQTTSVAGGVLGGTFGALTYTAGQMALAALKAVTVAGKATPVAADIVPIFDSSAAGAATSATVGSIQAANSFTTGLSTNALTTGNQVLINTSHGLTNPVRAECFLKCQTNDGTYSVGDIIPVSSLGHFNTGAADKYEMIHCVITAAGKILVLASISTSGAGIYACNQSTGAATALTLGSWKAYAIVYSY